MADNKNKTPPVGELYGRVYAVPTAFVADNERARARIGHYLENELHAFVGSLLKRDTEIQCGHGPVWSADGILWVRYIAKLELRDFLSLVTLTFTAAWDTYTGKRPNSAGGRGTPAVKKFAEAWIPFCRAVLAEEGLNYRIDDRGGVHPLVDEAFQLQRQTLLAVLGSERYAGARDHFETAHKHLGEQPPETRQAIWSMFQCVETIFQLLVAAKFNRGNIENKLPTVVQLANPTDDPESWKKVCDGLADWTDAFHRYRHGQAEERPRVASFALCVYALSTGADHARLLAELDSRTTKQTS
jgi:hypothetical protein